MNKKEMDKSNGISFAGKNRITLNGKVKLSPLLSIVQYLLVAAGVCGTVFCLISGFQLEVYSIPVMLSILAASVYFRFILLRPGQLKFYLPLSLILFLLAGYLFWHEIQNGFWYIENAYITVFNDYYNAEVLKFLVEEYKEKDVVTFFLIFLSVLISFLINGVILRNRNRLLFLLATLPIAILPVTVGLLPAAFPFAAYLACVVSIFGMGTTFREKMHLKYYLKKLSEKHKAQNRFLEHNFKYIIGLKIGGISALIFLLLVIGVSILYPPKLYTEQFTLEDTKNKIQKSMMEFSLEDTLNKFNNLKISNLNLFQVSIATGGLSGGKLGRVSEIKYNYETALRITTPEIGTGSLYLKGYVGSNYKGDSWEGFDKEENKEYRKLEKNWTAGSFNPFGQSSYLLSILEGLKENDYPGPELISANMKVEAINSDRNYIYNPYYSLFTDDSILTEMKSQFIASKNKDKAYQFQYFITAEELYTFQEEEEYNTIIDLYNNKIASGKAVEEKEAYLIQELVNYQKEEKAYRKFVYDTYRKVPKGSLTELKNEFKSLQYSEFKKHYGFMALEEIIRYVRDTLSSRTEYSLTPGILPKGKDFIEYFYYENQKGYCSHYASTAVMMLRLAGIPARYAEGYIVKPGDFLKGKNAGKVTVKSLLDGVIRESEADSKIMDIPDANAHAWVEIYLDGFGWIPVEVTPGFSGSQINNRAEEVFRPDTEKKATPIPKKEVKKEEKELNKKKEVTKEAKKQEEEKKTNSVSGTKQSEKEKNKKNYLARAGLFLLGLFIILAAALYVIVIRAFWINRKKQLNRKKNNWNNRILDRYKEILRIMEYHQIVMSDALTYQEAAVMVESKWKTVKQGSFSRFYEIALKAKFAKDQVTRDEAEEAEIFYRELIHSLYKDVSLSKKLYLKYIKVF